MPMLEDLMLLLATATPPAGAAEGAAAGGNPAPPWWGTVVQIVPILAIVAFMYLVLIAPQRRKQKEQQRMIDSLEKGARVTTIGGIHGTVVSVSDTDVTLKVDESANVKMKFQKHAVASVEQKGDDKK